MLFIDMKFFVSLLAKETGVLRKLFLLYSNVAT